MYASGLMKINAARPAGTASSQRRGRRQTRPETRLRKPAVEGLEGRLLLTAVLMSDCEQLVLELVNRARANPSAEAALYGIGLNEGLPANSISAAAKQPLAPNQALIAAAGAHSQDMLDRDFFAHVNPDGKGPGDRIRDAGYVASAWGENIASQGSTGAIDGNSEAYDLHASLFTSPGHRQNILNVNYRELGPGLRTGVFTSDGTDWNSAMLTENFGKRTGNAFLTGVAFSDTVVVDEFYSVGEGLGDVTVTARAAGSGAEYVTTTGPSGGYALQVPPGTYTLTATGGELSSPLVVSNVSIAAENVKVDLRPDSATASLVVCSDRLTIVEGGTAQFTVSLSAQPASSVTVTLAGQPGSDPDLTWSPNSLTFTPSNWNQPQPVTVRAAVDADLLDGTARVMISAPGMAGQTVVLDEDDTTTQDAVVTAPEGRKKNSLVLQRSNNDLQLLDSGKRQVLWQQPLASVQSLTILGVMNKADTLTVDFTAGGRFFLPQGVHFDGGGGTAADTLVIRGTAAADVFGIHSGRIDAAAEADTVSIEFTAVQSVRVEGMGGNDWYGISEFDVPVTVSDKAGVDTLDFSEVTDGGVTVDLNKAKGQWQPALPGSALLALKGTCEDVIGTELADLIRGNSAANRLWGRGGDDTLYGGSGNDRLYGQEGRDRLFGDSGNDVLAGGDDDDELDGGKGKDLLIGGAGQDQLSGSASEDILIGGTTEHDANDDALLSLLAEWASRRSWAARIDRLTNGGGLNGSFVLNQDTSVSDDLASDTLWGGSGNDWFLDFPSDLVQDRGRSDR